MSKLIDLTGQRFGTRVVIERAPSQAYKGAVVSRWKVRCDCKRIDIVYRPALLKTKMCKDCMYASSLRKPRLRADYIGRIVNGRKVIGITTDTRNKSKWIAECLVCAYKAESSWQNLQIAGCKSCRMAIVQNWRQLSGQRKRYLNQHPQEKEQWQRDAIALSRLRKFTNSPSAPSN